MGTQRERRQSIRGRWQSINPPNIANASTMVANAIEIVANTCKIEIECNTDGGKSNTGCSSKRRQLSPA